MINTGSVVTTWFLFFLKSLGVTVLAIRWSSLFDVVVSASAVRLGDLQILFHVEGDKL